jgi:hypothetical protein
MTESNTHDDVRHLREANGAMFTQAVTAGFDLTERALQSSLELLDVTRRGLFRATLAGIDWVEAVQPSPNKIVRELLGHLDKLSEEAIGALGGTVLAVARTARASGERAGELVASTTAPLVGVATPSKAA